MEEWRDVEGYEGLYQISSNGRVKRLSRNIIGPHGAPRTIPEAITLGHMGGRGYLRVKLSGDGRTRNVDIHPLVCRAFHGPKPTDKHQAAHGNSIKTDNRAPNLRWATAKENADDCRRVGGHARGEAISTGKLTESQVREIRSSYVKKYGIIKHLAIKYGVRQENIIAIVKRRSWKHIE